MLASVKGVQEWGGRIDIWVNNAAAFVFGKVTDVTTEDWDKVCTTASAQPQPQFYVCAALQLSLSVSMW